MERFGNSWIGEGVDAAAAGFDGKDVPKYSTLYRQLKMTLEECGKALKLEFE